MESCSICCFAYSEPDSSGNNTKKVLCCSHCLCMSCYLKLDKTFCPFCRLRFHYSKDELILRNSLNLDYNKWQPPSQITNYIPNERIRIRTRNTNIVNYPNSIIYYNSQIDTPNNIIVNEPFSRVRKNMTRKRRRNLSFDEVLERRKNIRKRCQKKWSHKNNRRAKETNEIF